MRLILAVLACLVPWGSARAAECVGLADLLAAGDEIVLGYNTAAAPFSHDSAAGPAGYMVDLCQAAVRRGMAAGTPAPVFRFRAVDTASQFDLLRDGAIHLACTPTTHTIGRRTDAGAAFSQTVFVTGADFLSRAGEPVRDLADLVGGTVTAVHGTTTHAGLVSALEARGLLDRVTVSGVDSHTDGVRALTLGTTRAHAGDQAILAPYLDEQPGLRLGGQLHSFEPYAIAMNRCDLDGRDIVDAGLARLFRSGEIWPIFRRNLGDRDPTSLLIATFILGGLPE